jgi:hypothetical protein
VWLHVSTTGGHYQAVKMYQNYNKIQLKIVAYKLNQIMAEHGLTPSVQKNILIEFKKRDPVRRKIETDRKTTEHFHLTS